jgi:hypothetical protein
MKRTKRFSHSFFALSCLSGLLILGCSGGKPTDAQLAASVQKQIAADPALQGQQIAVSASNGTVTLTGNVSGQGSRELASNDASQVKGVKTVVNDLAANGSSGSAMMNGQPIQSFSTAPPPPQQQAGPPPPQGGGYSQPPSSSNASGPAPQPSTAQPIVIPAGTEIRVQLGQTLSTKASQTGDPFSGTVVSPVRVNGQTIIRSGARASGTVIEAKSQGRFKGQAVLAVRLDSVRADGRTYPVQTSRVERVEAGKGKRSLLMTGGGAGLGALIGGLAGGGKGALIGGLLGGGGGAAGSAFTGNHDLVLPAESILTFRLDNNVTIRR